MHLIADSMHIHQSQMHFTVSIYAVDGLMQNMSLHKQNAFSGLMVDTIYEFMSLGVIG